MKTNASNKFTPLLLVLFLFVSLINLPIIPATPLDGSAGDGVWYDDFELLDNMTHALESKRISSQENCSLINETDSITLSQGNRKILYDANKADNFRATKHVQVSLLPYESLISQLFNPTLIDNYMLGIPFDKDELSYIKNNDGNTAETMSYWGSIQHQICYPMNHFQFTINEDVDNIKSMKINWASGNYVPQGVDEMDNSLEKIEMYIWTHGSLIPHWSNVDSVVYNDAINDTDIHLRYNEDFVYISDEGVIDILIIGTPILYDGSAENSKLYTDYVNLSVEIGDGYYTDGYVISGLISPEDHGKFEGWESIYWDGSRESSTSNIKLQVLDEKEKIITELFGNTEGFTTSPIDLSSLGDKYLKLKIKATLHSEELKYTAMLYYWGAMWQTKDGFYDSFSNNFRIQEKPGLKNEAGDLKISRFFGEWPIFGKNPANTRSYSGLGAEKGKNETYWQSYFNIEVGGDFKSPIVYDGQVYVASRDNRIYAFNTTIDKTGKAQKYANRSKANYIVDSSLAADDGLIVFGTNELSSKTNKIYALNSSDLSKVAWSYPKDDDDYICFSSAPTISNGRVFVTSWSGRFWTNPLVSYLYDKINELLGNQIKGNKLIALDLKTGTDIWDPIVLPAGSYSTPAVDDGLIFVGCDRLDKGSFFVFDENTGEELWNASIGLIGKSSPIIKETENGKVVYVTARDQEAFSIKGNDKLYAFKAETGEMLWNITYGENTTIFWNSMKDLGFNRNIATSSPISSPALYDDKLIVISPKGIVHAIDTIKEGEINWTFDITGGLGAFLPIYSSASPVVVDGTVYAAAEDGYLYALKIEDGTEKWKFTIEEPFSTFPGLVPYYIYASPVVADGLIFLSIIEGDRVTKDTSGKLFCVGEYSSNSKGTVISIPINVQKGKWWDTFNATVENTNENNTITFSILDEDGDVIPGYSNLDGDDNEITGIGTNTIHLRGYLNIKNSEETPLPILKDWLINWTDENAKPEFIEDSFSTDGGGVGGWINKDLPVCSIRAKDNVDTDTNLISGLDLSSAKFKIGYLKQGAEKPVTSSWYSTTSNEKSGASSATITANIAELDLDIYELINITFSIKDLAGNQADLVNKSFNMDIIKPISQIDDVLDDKYTDAFVVTATVVDDESGAYLVALKYRNSTDRKTWSDWQTYDEDQSPFSWSFVKSTSGYYQLLTIATDKAGNKEVLDKDKEQTAAEFLFDTSLPSMTDKFGEYKSLEIPSIDLEIFDDYKLDSIYYKPDNETDWNKINTKTINEKEHEITWSIPEDYWLNMQAGEQHYIFFKVTDICGNEFITTEYNSPLIIKDENITKFYVDLSDFSEWHWDDSFTITASIPGEVIDGSVELLYRYSEDNKEWSGWTQYGDNLTSEPYEWDFNAKEGSGYYEFKTKTTDEASGFVYYSLVESAKVSIFPTTPAILLIIFAIILVGITFYIHKKMKKNKDENQ